MGAEQCEGQVTDTSATCGKRMAGADPSANPMPTTSSAGEPSMQQTADELMPSNVYRRAPDTKLNSSRRPSLPPTTTLLRYVSGCAIHLASKPSGNRTVCCTPRTCLIHSCLAPRLARKCAAQTLRVARARLMRREQYVIWQRVNEAVHRRCTCGADGMLLM